MENYNGWTITRHNKAWKASQSGFNIISQDLAWVKALLNARNANFRR